MPMVQIRIHSVLYDSSRSEVIVDATVPGGEVVGYRTPTVASREALALALAKAPVYAPFNMLTGTVEVDADAFNRARNSAVPAVPADDAAATEAAEAETAPKGKASK